jgi:hypothetical protein
MDATPVIAKQLAFRSRTIVSLVSYRHLAPARRLPVALQPEMTDA